MKEHCTPDLPVGKKRQNSKTRSKVFSGAVLIMGASGIIAQLILLRELLITFFSNELTIGVILANWLILEAAGSWIGKFIEKIRRKLLVFVCVTGIFSICLPLSVYLARTWKVLAGAGPGEGMGFHQIFIASFIILLPVSFTHGILFTFSCRLMSAQSRTGAAGIGKVYYLETAGTLAGGLIFTFLMTTLLDSFESAFSVLIANTAACILLLLVLKDSKEPGTGISSEKPASETKHREAGSSSIISKYFIPATVLIPFVIAAFLLLNEVAPKLQSYSIRRQWQDQNVVQYQNSIYGNTTVVESEGEYTFFMDGIPAVTAPTPDIVFVEEFAHLPLLFQSRPEKVLVISGGAGGVINELLKHPVRRIDYVELDPLILKLVFKFPTMLTRAELKDPRVHPHFQDGRLFLRKTIDSYDVILVGLTDPQDLQLNRFFTKQFFSLVRLRLNRTGLIAFTLPGSLTYMGKELKDMNASVLKALSDVFAGVRVIPGDGYNLYLASSSADIASCDADCILKRYEKSSPATRYLKPAIISERLDPRWSRWFSESMNGATDQGNEDFHPVAVHYSLSYWNAKFAPRLRRLLALGERIDLAILVTFVVAGAFLLLLPVARSREPSRLSMPLAIAATGLTGMIIELALMFTFQALYGVVFFWMGFLITSFMTGVAAGGFAMTRFMERMRSGLTGFIATEAALTVFSLVLPLVFLGSQTFIQQSRGALIVQILFLALSLSAGLLIGLQFPLAGKIYLRASGDVGGTAGLLYGADLLGGWAGGIFGGVLLLPVVGLVNTCLFLGILKLASSLLVAVGAWRKDSVEFRGRKTQ